ncbi:MAG: ABC transporter permease [Syntrophotaleaceae bacterium]
MGYEWFVSLRYLRAKRKQTFISVISFISIAGVTLGVAALIIVLAVMTGFHDGVRQQILGNVPHVLVQQQGGISLPIRIWSLNLNPQRRRYLR